MSSIQLWPKQQEAFEFGKDLEALALFCEQRTGKTFITIKLLQHRNQSEEEPLCAVLIGLLNNKESTWMNHLGNQMPEVSLFTDWELFKKCKDHRMLLVHFESLPSMIGKLVKYKKLNWAGIDEGHRIAKRSTKQSKAASRLSWVPRRVLLTGTPIEKKPTDLFAQFRFLEPEVFGKNHAKFEEEYLDWTKIPLEGIPRGGMQWQKKILQQRILKGKAVFRQEKLPQLVELIKPMSFRLEQADVGIKPAVVKTVKVKARGEQKRVYDQLNEHSVVMLRDSTRVMAPLKITQIVKLRQIANGFIYDEDEELHELGSAKMRWLIKNAPRLSKPVVVFTAFKPDTDRVHRELVAGGYSVDKFDGSVKKSDRPGILKKFQAAKRDFIVCQIRTGGVGVDLWKSNVGVVYSMGHSFIDWDQAKSRMSSVNKSLPVKLYVLLTEDTIDEDLYDLVVVKGQTGQSVLKQLIRRIKPWQRSKKPKRKKHQQKRRKHQHSNTPSPMSKRPRA